jgi:fucose 4-O-acetylase-like acetyltransferase
MPDTLRQTDAHARVEWVDYCKGFGIFYVVFGHVLGGLVPSGIVSDSAQYRFVDGWLYAFHMPLFFFLSGLFAWQSGSQPFGRFISKKAATLAYPYFVWSLLQGLLETSHYGNHSLALSGLPKIVCVPIGQYWFLYALFAITVLYWLFRRITASAIAFVALGIICVAVELCGWDIVKWNVAHDVASFLVFFAAGVAVSRGDLLAWFTTRGNAALTATCLAGYAIIAIGKLAHDGGQDVLWLVLAIVGIVSTIALSVLAERLGRNAVVRFWGVMSLEIYVAHVLAASATRIVLRQFLGTTNPLAHLTLGIAVGMFAPIGLAYLSNAVGFRYLFTLNPARLQPWSAAYSRGRAAPRKLTRA